MENVAYKCLEVAMKGEYSRGTGGVVFTEKENYEYLLPHEIHPETFKKSLLDMMEEDDGKHFFVVHKDGYNLHVSKIPRMQVS